MRGKSPPRRHYAYAVAAYPLCGEHPATPPIALSSPTWSGTSFFSSKRTVLQNVMLTIADCHADESQHRM